MFNETHGQALVRKLKQAASECQEKEAAIRSALVAAQASTKRAREKHEEAYLAEEEREVARRRASYMHCTK
jgi:hypothetical protein